MGGRKVSPSGVGIKILRPSGADRNGAVTEAECAGQLRNERVGGSDALATVKEKRWEVCRMDGRNSLLTENRRT